MTVLFQINLSHVVPGKDPDTGEHFKIDKGPLLPADFGCKITAT